MILLFVNQQGAVASAGNPRAFSDLQTAMALHLRNLRAANSGKDLTTLLAKELPTVHSSSINNLDDLNTASAEYLLTHD